MMETTRFRRMMCMLVAGACLATSWAASAQELEVYQEATPFTKPMSESEHSFDQIGIVKEVPVEVGQRVKKGDVLVQLDDRADRARLKSLEVAANSTSQLDAAKAQLEVSKVQLESKRQMNSQMAGVASKLEIQEAELTVLLNEIKVKVEEDKMKIARLEVEEQQVKVDKMRLVSELDGIVSKVDSAAGESVDPERPAVTVVQNDPLRVVLTLPVQKVAKLSPGQVLQVRYHDETDKPWRDAKIHFISPVAMADSGYQDIELLLPNPENRAAGLHMWVKLPEGLDGGPEAPAAAAGE